MKVPAGSKLPGEKWPYVVFDVAEDHPRWLEILSTLQRWSVYTDDVRTEFSKNEVHSASWLRLHSWFHGYPQPDTLNAGYLEATYDLTNYCKECGFGGKQKAPFRMKREPKWGRHSMLRLFWVYDEIFVTPGTWNRIFKPFDVDFRPVLNSRGVELKTVVQLDIRKTVDIVTDGLAADRCEHCGRTRFNPIVRGPFPALREEPTASVVRTAQHFGSGGQSDQVILVSHEIARAITDADIHGVTFTPAAESAP